MWGMKNMVRNEIFNNPDNQMCKIATMCWLNREYDKLIGLQYVKAHMYWVINYLYLKSKTQPASTPLVRDRLLDHDRMYQDLLQRNLLWASSTEFEDYVGGAIDIPTWYRDTTNFWNANKSRIINKVMTTSYMMQSNRDFFRSVLAEGFFLRLAMCRHCNHGASP